MSRSCNGSYELFGEFPDGALWYVSLDNVLLSRLTFARTQQALALTPDLPLGDELNRLRAFEALTLTKGVDVTATLDMVMLAFSPRVAGYLLPVVPHALLFLFGTMGDLRGPWPPSLASLYEPRVLNHPVGLAPAPGSELITRQETEELLAWWVTQTNAVYSFIADPTQWTDDAGYHDSARQTAWMVSFERLIADALALLAGPQTSDLQRLQTAFDLLDKAEALLGYGRDRSGKGFTALLRRNQTLERLREAYASSMPVVLRDRLSSETARLFAALYEGIRDDAMQHRTTPKGLRVANDDSARLESISDEDFVSRLCRAVRNSSHGLLETLRDHPDRFLLAIHTGNVPAELTALAPLIAFGLMADVPAFDLR